MDKHNKIYLYLAIFIPILMIFITSFSLIFYKVDLHPQYNFIYMIKNGDDGYQCSQRLKADIFPNVGNQYKSDATNQSVDCSTAKLYEYDFATNKSHLISLQQITRMKLTRPTQTASPDGFVINSYCYTSDISGWGLYSKSYNSVCIKKGDLKQRLYINYSDEYPGEFYYFFFYRLDTQFWHVYSIM